MSAAQKKLARWLAVVVAATAVAAGLARTEGHRSLEDFYYDYWHIQQGVRYKPEHTAFVSMDDETLLALKDDPLAFWAPYFGQAMSVLTDVGVKAVGLDFIYQVSAEAWLKKLNLPDSQISRNYDTPLRAALASGNKILITHLVEVNGEPKLLTPPPDQFYILPGGLNDLGIANLYPDPDKEVRRFVPVMDPDPTHAGVSFAMQLALRAVGQDPSQPQWQVAGETLTRDLEWKMIGYTGPPGTIPTISMNALLQPDALKNPKVQELKGKIVIIAANNVGTSDRHFTPYSRGAHADQMPGGEIHANIVETILSGRYPRPLPLWAELAYLGAVLAVAAGLFLTLRVGVSAATAIALLAAVVAPGYFAFQHDWVLPVAELQTGLAAAFLMTIGLRLTGEERARSRMRQVFGRYVSDEVVNVLLAEDRKPDLAGETKVVTVLFSDIRGFTTISEKLSAHEVVEMLNAYFTRVCEPILAQGGTVDKYIGDAVMAVFGSPVTYPDHARRAVRAALGMAKEAEGFKAWMRERFSDRGVAEFGIGVGLFTGEAVIGDIGTPKRKEFTAIGDTVNAASRLEGVTKELKCVVAASESTVKAAGEGVRTGKVEIMQVKGRSEPIRVFEVVGIDET
ncbi:MAG TPA: adenylate/guanylate cyclase domain-containing protein [Burkholderiales bacterium]|nr:adenylate/guanylate cyclase domain-containing protein [Burkholderiales bacterium]